MLLYMLLLLLLLLVVVVVVRLVHMGRPGQTDEAMAGEGAAGRPPSLRGRCRQAPASHSLGCEPHRGRTP